MTTFANKLTLITGGSSGIGLAVAKKLAAQGAHVWILARRPQPLEDALKELESMRQNPDQKFGSLQCDIGNRMLLETTLGSFQKEAGTPDLLINAAGYAYPDTFLKIEPDEFYRQMDVNYFGTVNTIRCLLPAMLQRNSGYIVNVCSTAGFITFYGYTAYSASKYALRGFTDALRSELKFSDVRISLAFPPDTDTPGFQTENITKPEITKEVSKAGKLTTPAAVADSILNGIKKNRYLILTGFETQLIFRLSNLLGGWFYPVIDLMVASAAKKSGKAN